MITPSQSLTVVERKKSDLELLRQRLNGERQFSFSKEFMDPSFKDREDWNDEAINAHDRTLIDEGATPKNKAEMSEAFALQRDINYAHAGRHRLFALGFDSKFNENYRSQVNILSM
jgi:hypothetical protein